MNVVPIAEDQRRSFLDVLAMVFGFESTDTEFERFDSFFEWDRSRGAFDGDRLVSTIGAFSLEMTVPGATMPCGGTTVVSVLPTHRRRGILRMMIDSHLADVRDREEPIAGLWASDSAIYGRFGYGSAAQATEIEIRLDYAAFHRLAPGPTPARLITLEEAETILPRFYDEVRLLFPGLFARGPAWWKNRRFHDDRSNRNGFSPYRFAVTESGGAVTGYVQYRYKPSWTEGHGEGDIRIVEMFGTDASSWAGLWRYLLDHDLTARVIAPNRSLEDPIFELLAGRRRAKGSIEDSLWIRIMDVPRALEGRRYQDRAQTVIALHDPIDGSLSRWRLDLSPEGSEVTPGHSEPEVTMDLEDLGAFFMGWPRFQALGRAGRIEGDPRVLAALDRAFAWSPQPWAPEVF